MKIKNGNETVYEIITNHDFTLDEAIAFAGEYSNDAAINGEPEVTINSNDNLSIEFAHIPGTEVYNFGINTKRN